MVIGYKGSSKDRLGQWNTLLTLRSILRKEPLDKWKVLYQYMFKEYVK